MTGPEFEVNVRPRRGSGGSDLDAAATDYEDTGPGNVGREDP
jgi:hypothetical protein